MSGNCCFVCVKYLMFAFNFLFWLLGCAILGIGIWILADPNFRDYISGDSFDFVYTGAYILMAVGVIIMIIGFLGCCGVIRESQWMLTCFFIFLFIIFALLTVIGVLAVVQKDTLKERVRSMLLRSVEEYSIPERKKFMDNLQTQLKCCGSSSSGDYKGQSIPDSCYPMTTYGDGCADELFDLISKHTIIIAGVLIGIGVVMILGMIFSMCLCCEIRRAEDKY